MTTLSKFFKCSLAVFLVAAWAQAVAQSDWPSRPISLVVGFPPAGATDLTARAIAPMLGKTLGKTVVVENRPGASGNIGATYVLNTRDGHTAYLAVLHQAIYQGFAKNPPYDLLEDFRPVGMIASLANVLVVNASSNITSLEQYLALARSRPGSATCGHSGHMGSPHVLCELFKVKGKVDILPVPYKGSGPAMIALLAGEVTSLFETVPAAIAHIRGGKLRPLAVSSDKRIADLPNVPTFAELGFPDLVITPWNAIVMPRRTPDHVVAKFREALLVALNDKSTQDALRLSGLTPWTEGNTPEAALDVMTKEVKRWKALSQVTKISAD